ncbi:phosphopantothenoylcysteine decarboxylase subunit VHS3-like [Capsicum annuum]|uniref:phosphopantothenoylcysteine decarboxylase subunit VHS3-like n=1 Tax=Capsicum annuum TaxID=4072 RepID=UPI001FB08EF2|nr:phosphopantothenoylcysteine decarboxylase subunit VHS3-like [Capsicum annuum]
MLRYCYTLKEITIEFAEINTLQLIELRNCPPKLGDSAARIQQEQEELGNNPVDVRISDPLVRSHYNDGDEFDEFDDDDDEDEYDDDDDEDFDVDAAERDDN